MRKLIQVTTVLLAVCACLLFASVNVQAATGWVTQGTTKYYYDAAGRKTFGWSFIGGNWYYFGATTGIMQTGNLTDKGHLYYLRNDGRMAIGTMYFDEGIYTYDSSGALTTTKGWHKVNGYWYYFTTPNTVLTNGKTPDGHYVNEFGQWIEGAISKGIDVSRYQNSINWSSVKADGIDFAMIRIGSTKYGVDARFHENMAAANNVGLKVGAYVYSYATTVQAAIAEANFAINQLKNYTVTFPVAIDIESTSQSYRSPAELAAIANAFCSTLEAAGYYPIVYSSKSWFTERIDANAINYDLWVAQYNNECNYHRYSMWQSTSKGKVNGIAGYVDINYLFKDYATLLSHNGWLLDNGNYYYYKNHVPQKGFQSIDGQTYYFSPTGVMHTGWAFLNNSWYYFNKDGSMAIGWVKVKDVWYYMTGNGTMFEGWLQLGNDWFYLTPGSGAMLEDCSKVISGVRYYFDRNGYWIP
ncbi:MAG: hypothetical protein IJW18_00555 [Lachnospiraceae bacterium]|nr:hypothetical protein [Lachnospiraceae bacterium]